MKYYLAPLEGITTYIYRRAYHTYFHPMDKYFIPFLSPHMKKGFTTKELREIAPENHMGMRTIPQILTNHAQDFIRTVQKLEELGYDEINLNLGCPSKTVVSKGRGSGFLAKPEELDRFLDEIYANVKVKISIKTRLGKYQPDEFEWLLSIYNQYPVEELIIHPRVQQDYYKNTPNYEVFGEALKNCRNPVCYNGDLFRTEDVRRLEQRFPEVSTIMLGRGIIYNPGLVSEMEDGDKLDKNRLRQFHDQIYDEYQSLNMGERNVLFKMKEIWCYMGHLFPDCEKPLKKIKKAERMSKYEEAVREIL